MPKWQFISRKWHARQFSHAISIAPLQVCHYSEALPTQHGYCAGVSRRSATGNCELRTCPRSVYVTARAGVEATTIRLKAIDSTNAPSRPAIYNCSCKNYVLQVTNNVYTHTCKLYEMHPYMYVHARNMHE